MNYKKLYRIVMWDGEGKEAISGMIFSDKKLAEKYALSLVDESYMYMIDELTPEICGGWYVPSVFDRVGDGEKVEFCD